MFHTYESINMFTFGGSLHPGVSGYSPIDGIAIMHGNEGDRNRPVLDFLLRNPM
jgi:hypothetical protein